MASFWHGNGVLRLTSWLHKAKIWATFEDTAMLHKICIRVIAFDLPMSRDWPHLNTAGPSLFISSINVTEQERTFPVIHIWLMKCFVIQLMSDRYQFLHISQLCCAKFCSNHTVRIWMKTKSDFNRFAFQRKLLMKWAPGTDTIISQFQTQTTWMVHRIHQSNS